MEPERIALSQRERDRLKVLHEVKQKHVTQVEAGRRLAKTGHFSRAPKGNKAIYFDP